MTGSPAPTAPRRRASAADLVALAAGLDPGELVERVLVHLDAGPAAYWVTPLGIPEVAALAGVGRSTVDKWRQRAVMPASLWTVGGGPAWPRIVVVVWLGLTGRGFAPGAIPPAAGAVLAPVLDDLDAELAELRAALVPTSPRPDVPTSPRPDVAEEVSR